MTIREALKKRIKKVRLPIWNSAAYLKLPLLPNGMHGPWATLYDISAPEEGIPILIFSIIDDYGYEEIKEK